MNAEFVWNLLVKGSAILLIAGVVAFAMRRSSASRRHLVWLAALAGLLLVPVAQVRLPNWQLPADQAPVVTQLLAPTVLQPIVQAPGKHALFGVSPVFTPRAPAPQTPPFDYVAVIQVAWMLGCLGFLAWTAFGLFMVWLVVRSGKRSDLAESICQAAAPNIRILICPKLRVPAMAGIVRPAILLPGEALIWDRRRLEMVVAHEAAHIRRHDWLWQVLGQIACSVHFFNPLAWVALKQLRKDSELACDDFVLGLGFDPDSYARTLLEIARNSRFQVANTVGMARSADVEGRLRSIVDDTKNRKWVSGRTVLSVVLSAIAIVTPLAIVKAMPGVAARRNLPVSGQHSGQTLPHIHWVRSKEIAPNTYLAKNGIAGLPGGYSVRLVGVSSGDPSSNIWGLDGRPLPGAELWVPRTGKFWSGNVFSRGIRGAGGSTFAAFGRVFYVEVESDVDATPSITFEMVSPSATTQVQKLNMLMAGGGEKIPEVPLTSYDPSYAPIGLAVPSRAETGTVRFGITSNGWQTVADIKNPVSVTDSGISRVGYGDPKNGDQCALSLSNEPNLWYLDVHMQSHEIKLMEGTTLSSDTARRVLLYDKDGQPIDPGRPGTMMDGFQMYGISAKNFSRIARVVVQTTPYIWAEFRGVPLKPDFEKEEAARVAAHAASLESGVHGTATGVAPGFTKQLGDGTTVSIRSITKAVRDNDSWVMTGQPSWRADGEVLAQRADLNWFTYPYLPKYPDPPVDLDVNVSGTKGDASTFVQFTAKFNPKSHLPIFGDGDRRVITVKPGDKYGAARVGVASGEWVTVSSQNVDMPDLPSVTNSDPANDSNKGNRTGFEVVVGENCYFHDMVADTKVTLASEPLSKDSVRVVARLKSGELRQLGMGMSGAIGSIYPVPARHGEWTEGYSHILAGEVQSVEIQVRPYEFVEFDHIALQHR